MIIRPGVPADAPVLCAISNRLIDDTLATFTTVRRTPEDIGTDIDTCGPAFLVAEEAGEALGFASYRPFRSGPGYRFAQEHSVNLLPKAHRRGVGRQLMQALEDVARSQCIHVLIAGISSANPGAIAFHKAIGFTQAGRLAEVGHKWDQWLDLIFLQKILVPDPDSQKPDR